MAKSKKNKAEAAEGGAKKSAKSAKPAPPPPAAPLIDTNLAAAAAAKLVAHKDELSTAPAHGESAAFKQLKENLHKTGGQSTPSFLQNMLPSKKFNPSIPGRNQQIGRNQTFGTDVNRSGVPRRTGG